MVYCKDLIKKSCVLKKPSEKQIETFVRHPDELSNSELTRIKTFLKSDEELRLLAEWFSRFYDTLDEYISDTKKAAVDKGWVSSTLELKPLSATKKNGRRTFVLAAHTETANTPAGVEQIRTFASKKYGTLIRVLSLKSKKATKIDVISDHIQDDDIVILSVPGSEVHLVTQPGGKIEIPSDQISGDDIKNWVSCRVNLPVLKSKVNRDSSRRDGFLLAKSLSEGTKSIEIQQESENVEIYPDSTGKNIVPKYMVLAEEDKLPTLWELNNGKATIPKEKFQNKEVSLFFYN